MVQAAHNKQSRWLELFYSVISQESADLNRQLERALELTMGLLGMEFGTISQVNGDIYEIDLSISKDENLKKGQRYDIGFTYCSIMSGTGQLLALNDVGHSQYKDHPCYRRFELESYIGVPLQINDKLYGSLSFSSYKSREKEFDEIDKRFIRLLGEWAEGIIKRRWAEQKEKEQRENLIAIVENSESLIWSIDNDYRLMTCNSAFKGYIRQFVNKPIQPGDHVFEGVRDEEKIIKWKQRYDEVFTTGKSQNYTEELSLERETQIYGVSLYPIKNEDGELKGISAFAKNITETEKLQSQINKLYDLSKDLMVVSSSNGVLEQINPAFEDILGYKQEELLGTYMQRWVHPDDVQELTDKLKLLAKEQRSSSITNRCRCADGSYRWISWRIDSDHKTGLFYGTGHDITREKEIRDGLKFREERYGLAIEGTQAAIWDWEDVNEDKLWWSPTFYDLIDYDKDEIEHTFSFYKKLIHPDDLKKALDLLEAHFRGEADFEVEYRFRMKSGEYRWFLERGQADFDENGNPTRMVGTINDIETRKRNEELLTQTQEMLHIGGWEYIIETEQLTWTDEIYRIFELPVGSPIDVESAIEFYAPSARPKISNAIQQCLKEHEPYDIETPLITAKNKKKWVRSVGKPHLHDGKVYKLSGTFQDLTQRKEMEDELVEAKEKADMANKAKSQFIANMSHEIRTPMNAILGFAELLTDAIDEEPDKSYVKNIHSSGKNLLMLINDILDLSKIESGKQELNLGPVDIPNLINELREMFSINAEKKDIILSIDVDEAIPVSLLMDGSRIRQILLNLLGNAIKFTHTGKVKLSASIARDYTSPSSVDITFSISDTGIGIRQEKLDTIFKEFEQENFKISQQYGGTGLGLTISKRLVGLMGGTIKVESTYSEGSTFTVTIPDVAISSVAYGQETDALNFKGQKLNEGKVLLVDDIAINRELVLEFLQDQPLEIIQAKNGLEATQLAQEENPDIIIMDIKMPELDGIEAMRRIKNESDIVIIALTASGMTPYGSETSKNEFDAFLRKPITKQQLIQALAEFLGTEDGPFTVQSTPSGSTTEEGKVSYELSVEDEDLLEKDIMHMLIPALKKIDLDIMFMSQYEELAVLLNEIGSKHDFKYFMHRSDQLRRAVSLFDTEEITSQIKELKKSLGEIETILENS